MKEAYVPTKGMKIGIVALIAHFPLIIYGHHIALDACMVNQQAASAITAGMAAFAAGFGAYQVKRRRSIFGRVVAGWLDDLRENLTCRLGRWGLAGVSISHQ